jgi:hypothetical protein
MKKVVLVFTLILLSSNTFGEDLKISDYERGYNDGTIYLLTDGFENEIRNAYDVLIKIEKMQGKEIDEVKDLLIKRINGNLCSLGSMVADNEKGKLVSPDFYKQLKKEEDQFNQVYNEVYKEKKGSDKLAELNASIETDIKNFWKSLKKEREEKNWKLKYKNEKIKNSMEKEIDLALETFIEYGNVFKMEY